MASLETVMSAEIFCTNGTMVNSLIVDPITILVEGMLAGNTPDGVGDVNILAFGFCDILQSSCTPLTAVWVPGNPTVLMQGFPALAQLSVAPCAISAVVDAVSGVLTGGTIDEEGGPAIVLILSPNNFTVFV